MYYRKKSINDSFKEFWERVIIESEFYNKNTGRITYKKIVEDTAEKLSVENFQNYHLEELEERIFKKVFSIIALSYGEIEKMVFEPETVANELKNRMFLHEDISLNRISFMYLGYALRNYTSKVISGFLTSPFMLFIDENLEEKNLKLKTRLIISFIILVAILRKVRKVFDKKTSIENSGVVCDIKKKYSDMSMFQIEFLKIFENSKIIDEETQNKILRIARISEYFEEAVNGYYIKIEYSKNAESIVKIVKAI